MGAADVHTTLPAPTIFTGQKLNGSLCIIHYGVEEVAFDAVQFILKGMQEKLEANIYICVKLKPRQGK